MRRMWRFRIGLVGLLLSAMAGLSGWAAENKSLAATQTSRAETEPNVEVASAWWPDLTNIWTPIGWKNHGFRFNVLFNGTILVVPQRHQDLLSGTPKVQITFAPITDDMRPGKQLAGLSPAADDRRVVQSWKDDPAPVLASDWIVEAVVFRQEIFAHIPSGQDVQTGAEPLFAWVRLSIRDSVPGMPLSKKAGFAIKLNSPFVFNAMSPGQNIRYVPDQSKYPAALTSEKEYNQATGYRVFEDGGKVRLGIAPGRQCEVEPLAEKPRPNDSTVTVLMANNQGNYFDVLIPLAPVERPVFDQELALGYEGALEQANRYWSKTPASAATFHVPEEYINQLIRRNLQMSQVVAEKNPVTGEYSMLTGSWAYSQGLWATPGSLAMNFFDLMGYHEDLGRYLEIFKSRQGTVLPPGPSYSLHPGYLSTPKTLTSVDWMTDHGALLWAISEHALLTGDQKFIDEWLPGVVKACDFIKDARRLTNHSGVRGILPPAASSDLKTQTQRVWSEGWNYKGLATAVKLLKRTHHPRAQEFAEEADAHRLAVVKALREKMETMPTWTDQAGKVHRHVPASISGESAWETRAAGLDDGPMVLVFAGLLPADDEIVKSSVAWFREGPPTAFYRLNGDCGLLPSLHHEMSSFEPCYSWNIFHSWQLGDRAHFLEGLYSLLVGSYSRQTYTPCETRGGMTGNTNWTPSLALARLSVIDDQLGAGELHLLRLMPLAWLARDGSRFENMPTEFGPITLRVKLIRGEELDVSFEPRYRETPERLVLHIPPVPGLKSVRFNGRQVKATQGRDYVLIPR